MKLWRITARLALAAGLLWLTGCINLGPDYRQPPPPVPPPSRFQHAAGSPSYRPQDRWWEELGDPRLNQLVQKALARNWDVKKAAARVLELRARFVEAGAARYPRLNLEGRSSRRQATANTSLPSFINVDRRTDQHDLSLAASFELDLWGRLEKAEQAARAELLAAQENRRTVRQTVVAEVVSAYLKLEALERRLGVLERSLAAHRDNVALVSRRFERGLASLLDLKQARRALASTKAQRPTLLQELGLQQQALAVLVGDYPHTEPARPQPQDYFKPLPPVPAGLPSELLLRRPDLRAALARVKALYAQVGVAKAARFPTIRLTASYGYSSQELGDLFNPGSELWNLAAGLVQPLFDAGRLESRQRAAEARLKQGLADYAKAALRAFREVESALLVRRRQLERRRLLQEALKDAIATERAAKNRYLRGLTDYLRVLEAQFTRYNLEDALVLNELAILTNRVTLHRALGGGWASARSLGAAKSE